MNVAPLVVERPKDKRRIVIQVKAVTVEQETTGGALALTSDDMVQLLSAFHKESPLPKIDLMRHDVVYIEPFSLPFHELLRLLKTQYLRPSAITESSTDIGLIWDQQADKILKHVQAGPMDKTQLQGQFLRWPSTEKLPETLVFLNLAYQTTDAVDFSKEA
ncbi:MAG: hypothetical protein HY665_08500, partial [Chloroflexi bacterium]|nr:hypothetical protein [Chloroflexota bacterium]